MPWRLPFLNTTSPTEPLPQARSAQPRWRERSLPAGATGRAYANAVRYLEAGQWEAAIGEFERLAGRAGRNPLTAGLAHFYLCEAHLACALSLFDVAPDDAGASETALSHLRQAAELEPHYPDLFYQMGRIYLRQNRDGDAFAALDHALDLNPGYARAHLLRGVLLYRSGEREGGLLLAEVALAMDATLSPAFVVDARYADAHDDFPAAERLLREMSDAGTALAAAVGSTA